MLHLRSRIGTGISRNRTVKNGLRRLTSLYRCSRGVSLLLVFIAGTSYAAGKLGAVSLLYNVGCLVRRKIDVGLIAESHAITGRICQRAHSSAGIGCRSTNGSACTADVMAAK